MSQSKLKILLIGSGGIGTITAYALETGGLAEVTAILRSNFAVVEKNGFTIDSVDHGYVQGWRPSHSTHTHTFISPSVNSTNRNGSPQHNSNCPRKKIRLHNPNN